MNLPNLKFMADWLLFAVIVVWHYIVFVGLVIAPVYFLIDKQFLLVLISAALAARLATSRELCPLTSLENRYRERLGMKKSTGFIKDWVIKQDIYVVAALTLVSLIFWLNLIKL